MCPGGSFYPIMTSTAPNPYRLPLSRSLLLSVSLLSASLGAQEEPLTELEEFIATESRIEDTASLLSNRPIDSLYGTARALVDLPRSVTVINAETMARLGLEDVYDLPRAVPGSSVVNYYGVPGIPTTRGLFTGIYFNGMQRVWNRNGYPTSFGSLEAMDYVRGPAPGSYSAASPGGFVNFVPKSPYFDATRGSVSLAVGSYDKYVTKVDVGGPTLLLGKPTAWRISITNQDADSYYTGIFNDYFSAYGSLKMRISDTISIFTGGEFYRHRSKENPGWNRVTQNLIDNGQYLIGSPLNDLTGATVTFPGPFGGSVTVNNSTPGFVSREALETTSPFGGIRGQFARGSPFVPANFSASLAASLQYLSALNNPTGATVALSRRSVLTDPADFADADTYLFFFDTIANPREGFRFTNKFFLDSYKRQKESTYGYGEFGENLTLENKILIEQSFDALAGLDIAYGASVRYEDSLAKTEFTVEPFGRRDLSQPPTQNDRLFTGDQLDSNGSNFWDPFGSYDTQLWTFGTFLTADLKVTDAFAIIGSARVDHATWERMRPADVQSGFGAPAGATLPGGGKTYYNFSISPSLKVAPGVVTYATYQVGTSYQGFYVSGGVSAGDANYQESSLAEAGIKASLLEGKLFAGASIFHMDLVNFDTRGGQATPQRGRGIELETTYDSGAGWSVLANATWQEHFFRTATIPGGFIPLTEAGFLLYGGGAYLDFGGRPNPGGARYGIPEFTFNVLGKYEFSNGWGISGGPSYTDSMFGNPDKTITLPSALVWSGQVFYRKDDWELTLAVNNITDEKFFYAQEAFSANAIILPSEPTTWEVTLKYKF